MKKKHKTHYVIKKLKTHYLIEKMQKHTWWKNAEFSENPNQGSHDFYQAREVILGFSYSRFPPSKKVSAIHDFGP